MKRWRKTVKLCRLSGRCRLLDVPVGPDNRHYFPALTGRKCLPNKSGKPFGENYFRTLKGRLQHSRLGSWPLTIATCKTACRRVRQANRTHVIFESRSGSTDLMQYTMRIAELTHVSRPQPQPTQKVGSCPWENPPHGKKTLQCAMLVVGCLIGIRTKRFT